jgi:hypothetical protein
VRVCVGEERARHLLSVRGSVGADDGSFGRRQRCCHRPKTKAYAAVHHLPAISVGPPSQVRPPGEGRKEGRRHTKARHAWAQWMIGRPVLPAAPAAAAIDPLFGAAHRPRVLFRRRCVWVVLPTAAMGGLSAWLPATPRPRPLRHSIV